MLRLLHHPFCPKALYKTDRERSVILLKNIKTWINELEISVSQPWLTVVP